MKEKYDLVTFLVSCSLSYFAPAGSAFCAPPDVRDAPAPEHRKFMIERHNRMAELHRTMSHCLDSGKNYDVCHKQMIQACESQFGDECLGMGKRHMMGFWDDGCWKSKALDDGADSGSKKLEK